MICLQVHYYIDIARLAKNKLVIDYDDQALSILTRNKKIWRLIIGANIGQFGGGILKEKIIYLK